MARRVPVERLVVASNRNDILFQSVDPASQLGFFANFPKTRHQGIDAQFTLSSGAFDLSAASSMVVEQ